MIEAQQVLHFDDHGSLRERAERWAAENPEAMRHLERLAMEKAAHGQRFGMKALVESLRWNPAIRASGDGFKVNNLIVSMLARLLAERHPEVREFMRFREARS